MSAKQAQPKKKKKKKKQAQPRSQGSLLHIPMERERGNEVEAGKGPAR